MTEAGHSAWPKAASSAGTAVMKPVRVFRRFRDLRQASLATARARALEVDLELLLPNEA